MIWDLYDDSPENSEPESGVSAASDDHYASSDGEEYETDALFRRRMKSLNNKYLCLFNMDYNSYMKFMNLVKPEVSKQFTVKNIIPINTRLQICLRYLASGNLSETANEHEVTLEMALTIVKETCSSIWKALKDIVFPQLTREYWRGISENLHSRYEINHCVGVADMKKFVFESPIQTETDENKECLTVFSIAAPNYIFSMIKIETENVLNDKLNFTETAIAQDLQNNLYNFPPPENYHPIATALPYVLTSNGNLPQTNQMLRVYPKTEIDFDKPQRVYNIRVRDSLLISQNAYTLMTKRWKVLQKKFDVSPEIAVEIVKALCCLHNFAMNNTSIDIFGRGTSYSDLKGEEFNIVSKCLINVDFHVESHNKNAEKLREKFKEVFYTEFGDTPLEFENMS